MGDPERKPPRASTGLWGKVGYTAFGGVVTTIIVAIAGIISTAYIEISFKDPSLLKDWKNIREWMDVHVDWIKPKTFHAYYGDNDDGKTVIRDKLLTLRYFSLTNKVIGIEENLDDKAKYAISGFWKDELVVLAHRGEKGGQGVYVLKMFSTSVDPGSVFVGYIAQEDWIIVGEAKDWFVKCPIVVLEESASLQKYADRETLKKDFPFMNTKCVEFVMPTSLQKIVQEARPIDEIVGATSR